MGSSRHVASRSIGCISFPNRMGKAHRVRVSEPGTAPLKRAVHEAASIASINSEFAHCKILAR